MGNAHNEGVKGAGALFHVGVAICEGMLQPESLEVVLLWQQVSRIKLSKVPELRRRAQEGESFSLPPPVVCFYLALLQAAPKARRARAALSRGR